MIPISASDVSFAHSPDAGDPDCFCSRCSGHIKSHECPLRMFSTNGAGEVDENSHEYRYCEKCMAACGIVMSDGWPEMAPDSSDFEGMDDGPEERP